ncbi:TPA: FliM/FliN family flagellar motor switch protein [Candidatus Scatousia excrementigallinarum]|uniref:FliM/FliN family flagellar motor switch protein n=1 Tax=Candidatus Scatousia excrementigallinarum TaxID=2840935 RepID=A0A9D1EY12_9BACT|nr:FliM/FliN family flagellar motor switch protein [Candidatus Scatousia excrementigallinarum]
MGKFIISVPDGRLKPNRIECKSLKFENKDFYKCPVKVKIEIGSTRFTVKDLKGLEPEDIILLENSNLQVWKVFLQDYTNKMFIDPNMELVHPLDDNGGEEMTEEPNNLWDSIEVDMYAELDPVKITLGDLKKIEEGLVVDVAALYDNKVTLRVENKVIGHGELVIINDRYGVKVSDIVQKSADEVEEQVQGAPQQQVPQTPQAPVEYDNSPAPEGPPMADNNAGADDEDEFDYSDFELEDEDI